MNHTTSKKSAAILILSILLCCIVSVLFFSTRTQPHVDEVWSYMLSNKHDSPFLYSHCRGIGEDAENIEDFELTETESYKAYFSHWHDSEYYRNALTVQPGEQFAYDRVYYNQTRDVHPPLYYFLLHTVCSFFPNRFSWWYAFAVNLVFYIGSLLMLYAVAKQLGMNDFCALLSIPFWGISLAGITMICFLRMYLMLAFFMLAVTYLHIRLMQDFRKRYVIGIMLLDTLSFLTQYYAYIYVFFITLFYILYLFYKRRFRRGILFGFTILSCVFLSVMLFPSAIRHVFAGTYSGQVTYGRKQFILSAFFSAANMVIQSYTGLKLGGILPSLVCILLLVLLIVKLLKLQKQENIKDINKENLRIIGRALRDSLRWFARKLGSSAQKLVLLSATVSAAVITCVSPKTMGVLTVRYLFPILPLFSVLIIFYAEQLIPFVLRKLKKDGKYRIRVLSIVCAAGIVLSLVLGTPSSFLQNAESRDDSFKQYFDGSSVMLVDTSHHTQAFSELLMQAAETYPADKLDETLLTAIITRNHPDAPFYVVISFRDYQKPQIDSILKNRCHVDAAFLGEYYITTDDPGSHYFYRINV